MRKINILLIEDDTLISMQLENLVSSLGHTVVKNIKNSQEILETKFDTQIDLIISDIRIEGDLDGISTSKILLDKYGIPVIFLTAYKDIETLQKASTVDYAGYLVKPFREDELTALINLTILKYNLPKLHLRVTINDEYSYCMKTNELFFNDKTISLTKSEITFLQLLINAKGEIVTYETIENSIWGNNSVSNETRRQLIYRFKQKVPKLPLKLEKGVGYRLVL